MKFHENLEDNMRSLGSLTKPRNSVRTWERMQDSICEYRTTKIFSFVIVV